MKKHNLYSLILIAVFSALISVCAWIYIPTAVPFTMQTFGVALLILISDTKKSLLSISIYIMLGLIGIPVFSGFQGGPSVLLGKTGGYILGFIPMVIISSLLIKHLPKRFMLKFIALLIGQVSCYIFGTLWFVFLYGKSAENMSFITALSVCVLPYIIPDLIKLSSAILVAKRITPYINKGE